MGKCSRKDNISDLPQNIIEKILTKIPIRDAVKTSILSTKWRYQWTTMTRLVFDEIPGGTSDEQNTAERKLANFVTQFLLLHDGPILALEVIENLISGCPLLEKFKFRDMNKLALSVQAPNMKHLMLAGNFRGVYLEHTPLLVSLSLTFSTVWADSVLVKVPVTYDSLKVIELGGIEFEAMNAVSFALHLILQAPNLQELRIIAANMFVHEEAAGLDFWEKHCPTDFTFKHLKVVKMSAMSNEREIEFIKFVLGRSPVLEMMSVSPPYDSREQMNMVNEVLLLGQAFPNVEIKFLDP